MYHNKRHIAPLSPSLRRLVNQSRNIRHLRRHAVLLHPNKGWREVNGIVVVVVAVVVRRNTDAVVVLSGGVNRMTNRQEKTAATATCR